jgi:hypothetical protein
MPLAHPAHVLHQGKVTLGAGVAGTIVAGPSASAADPSAVRLQQLAVAPDVSPWVSARAGLGSGFEAGLSASSRAIRLDARHAFESDRLAMSIGLGASALLAARPTGGANGGDASGVYGGGFDVPVLVGWRSSADLYAVWLGPRVGADFFSGQIDAGPDGLPGVSGHHLHYGGVLGLRAGLRHVYGVVEVEGAYHQAGGTFTFSQQSGVISSRSLDLGGWTVAPSGALVVSF